ncbi:MAG TPA: hypothetical protein VKS03_07075, partial [Thermoanaerobaculia bacterium]|nr:hypothetical protein [Thermoanaerobaculia bacterium]
DGCNNIVKCTNQRGAARVYKVKYSTGDPYSGSDRGETQQYANFLTNPVPFQAADQQTNVIFTSDNEVTILPVPGGTKTNLKDWKENDRPRQ